VAIIVPAFKLTTNCDILGDRKISRLFGFFVK